MVAVVALYYHQLPRFFISFSGLPGQYGLCGLPWSQKVWQGGGIVSRVRLTHVLWLMWWSIWFVWSTEEVNSQAERWHCKQS